MFKQHVNTPRYAKDAATKHYVDGVDSKLQTQIDDAIATIPPPVDAYTKTESDSRYVNTSGDTMTGTLVVPVVSADGYTVKAGSFGAKGPNVFNINWTTTADLWIDGANLGRIWTGTTFNPANYVAKAGDTMTGLLNISSPPYYGFIKFINSSTGHEKTFRLGATSELEIVNSANTAVIWTLTDLGDLTLVRNSIARRFYGQNVSDFAPAAVDNAAFIGVGSFGGGITLQDGAYRACMWAQSANLALATGGNPPSIKLLLANNNNHTLTGSLSLSGTLETRGADYGTQIQTYNTTTGHYKYIRMAQGTLEIINHAYNASIFSLADGGSLWIGGGLTANSESRIQHGGGIYLRFRHPNYGGMLYQDTTTFYFLTTNNGDPDGTFNNLRPFTINLSSGVVGMSHGLNLTGRLNAYTDIVVPNLYCTYGLRVYGWASNNGTGLIFYNAGETAYTYYDGLNFTINIPNGGVSLGSGFFARQGIYGNTVGYRYNLWWDGTPELFVDSTYLGDFAFVSDYRIKENVDELPSMWDTMKKVRPVKYTKKQYTPPNEAKRKLEEAITARENSPDSIQAKEGYEFEPMFKEEKMERWGFIAHELQEVLIPSAASGIKDQENAIQSVRLDCVVAALTKTVQECIKRIETLETK